MLVLLFLNQVLLLASVGRITIATQRECHFLPTASNLLEEGEDHVKSS